MAVGDVHVFSGFFTPVLTQLFFLKPPITIPTCFCRGERRKFDGKKVRLNRESNSQPPGRESDTLSQPGGSVVSAVDQWLPYSPPRLLTCDFFQYGRDLIDGD